MPEQNTPVPIRREDIRKGDRVRRTEITEWVAGIDYDSPNDEHETFELLSRPVVLPTEPGIYLDKDGGVWSFSVHGYLAILAEPAHGWFTAEHMAPFTPFTLLRPVPEVAAEVLADVRNMIGGPNAGALLHAEVDKIAAKYGATQ